jgi:hypothetical protein
MTREVIDCGDSVICDFCNDDYTESEESGGFITGGYAVCPKCAPESMKNIKKYNEEHTVKRMCGVEESFSDMVRDYRGENNKITIISGDEADKYFGLENNKEGELL